MVQHIGNHETSTTNNKFKAIPLPPPQFSNGNAYGGNQSFVQSSNDMIMGTPLITASPSYWDNAAVAGSSNSTERIPGVVGLTNIGNTCFMNSGLQCLLNTPSLSEFFLKSKPFSTASQKLSLLNHFQHVVKQTWYGPNSKINLHDFKSGLAAIHSQFNDSRQHDCQEFLALLLDSLHEQLKKWSAENVKLEDSRNVTHNTEIFPSKVLKEQKPSHLSAKETSIWITEEATSTDNRNIPSPSTSNENDISADNKKGPAENDVSVTNKKANKLRNLSDGVFSQERKHTGLSVRSNETVSTCKSAAKFTAHVKNPVHSGLKSQNMVRNRLVGNFEAKYKYQNKNTRLKGATISLFQLPNFTPPGHVSNVNNDKDISSTSSNSAAIKENKWMDLKNHGTYGKFNVSRNRKKKCEDGDSPGSRKKLRIDFPAKSPASDAKRKLDFAPDKLDRNETVKSARFEAEIAHNDEDENYPASEHLMNGTDELECNSIETDCSTVRDIEVKEKKLPPKRPTKVEESERASTFWKQHIDANNTVIAKTFQGLLKSTVICSTCDYNSVTYEPFMYLSLPFPRVLERKLVIWFISMKDRRPVKLEVTVGLMDDVKRVKHEVGKIVPGDRLHETEAEKLILSEVYNYNVHHRSIDNSTLVRKLNDNHNLYVFELNDNFDERYNSHISFEADNYAFSSSFLMSDSINVVSSTTRGQMNASTYLDEDWDQDAKLAPSEDASLLKDNNALLACKPAGKFDSTNEDEDWEEACASHDTVDTSSGRGIPSGSNDAVESSEMSKVDFSDPVSVVNDGSCIPGGEPSTAVDDGFCGWSDQICAMEPSGSSEADDSGLGSGTSDSADSGIIGGTCEATDSDLIGSTCETNADDLVFGGCDEPNECGPGPSMHEDETLTEASVLTNSNRILPQSSCSNKIKLNDGGNEVNEDLNESGNSDEVNSSNGANATYEVASTDDPSDLSIPDLLPPSDGPELHDSHTGNAAVSSSDDGNNDNGCSWKMEEKSETVINSTGTMHCIICLEDCLLTDMRQHMGCDCVICVNCVKSSIQHFVEPNESPASSNKLKCATCMKIVDGTEFVQYKCITGGSANKLTMELVPILFRNDPNPDANNNSLPVPRIFGYPWLVKLPSTLPAEELYDYIASINPFPQVTSKILTVTPDGKSCGQCGYASSCYGCELSRVGNITFGCRTHIAISYTDLNIDLLNSIEPTDMAIEEHSFGSPAWVTPNEPHYDIHDCLRAFSEIEHLDEQNPWFCPHCEKNQCATKALSVCHFPDYLIVYLKRFVFLDHSSNKLNNKLKFPVNDLDLSEYIATEFSGKEWKYDLYGCICHFGSVSSGHYTAFGKNPSSGDWHYFNDDVVSPQCPKDLEHSSAYVLFYARNGVQYDIPVQAKVRPLPGLNTLNASRPVNVVTPSTSNADDPWEPEDIEVTSSSGECSYPSQPVHCSAFSGGTVDTMDEMSLSVGTRRSGLSQWSGDKVDEDYCWDNEKDPIATGEDYKSVGSKHRSTVTSGLDLDQSDEYDPTMFMNGQEFPEPLQTMTTTVNNDILFPSTYDNPVDIPRGTDTNNILD